MTDEKKLWSLISEGVCPDCLQEDGFLEGPSGGMATNIKCANSACGSEFNVMPMIGRADRI